MNLDWLEKIASKQAIENLKEAVLHYKVTGTELSPTELLKVSDNIGASILFEYTEQLACDNCVFLSRSSTCEHSEDCMDLDQIFRDMVHKEYKEDIMVMGFRG